MFGTITIKYKPAVSDPSESEISLSFSSEANLKECLRQFERFLRVMEYPLDAGDSLELSPTKDCPQNKDFGDRTRFDEAAMKWALINNDNMNRVLN